jgi:hypothetical protein
MSKHPITWNINLKEVNGYHALEGNTDEWFEEVPGTDFAILFYNLIEAGMLNYHACFCIFSDKKAPRLVANSWETNMGVPFNHSRPFYYAFRSNCFAICSYVYIAHLKKSYRIFLLVNPVKNQFALIDWEHSYYYAIEEVAEDRIRIFPVSISELERFPQAPPETIIDLLSLEWIDLRQLSMADKIFESRLHINKKYL